MRSRAIPLCFVLGCIAMMVLGLPARLGAASSDMPGWARMAVFMTVMGLSSAAVVVAWATFTSRMLAWTRRSIAHTQASQR